MEYPPELVPLVAIPYYYESHKDTALLRRRELFLPNPHLKHVMLSEKSSGYGSYDAGGN